MIVIKIELWPKGNADKSKEIGRAYLWNDGSGTKNVGHYKGKVMRRGSQKIWKEGTVKNFPRLRLKVWNLVYRFLDNILKEE